MSKYDHLRKEYPQTVSKEQLYKICGIAKDTAWVFLHSGVIPCEDTGKKTRRYIIKLDDVIDFMEKRDLGQIPARGDLMYLRPRAKKPGVRDSATWKQYQTRYFQELLKDAPDAITPQEMGDIVGLSKTIIQQHILHGNIDAENVGRFYMISKESVLAFMHSSQYQEGNGCSEKFNAIMEGLACLEKNLKKLKDNKREAKEIFDGDGDHDVPLDVLRRYYLKKLKKCPDTLTVHDLTELFSIGNKFILEILRGKKIWAAMVEGKYLVPQKCVAAFLDGAHFSTMVKFHQHLWARMRT